mmetsp:Transcript_17859/g.39585  ORF Transcript_17859/g.39585 Transcript_17859/m.39585 type:complete len:643 (-) Transcript_17859:4911-6839(-)
MQSSYTLHIVGCAAACRGPKRNHSRRGNRRPRHGNGYEYRYGYGPASRLVGPARLSLHGREGSGRGRDGRRHFCLSALHLGGCCQLGGLRGLCLLEPQDQLAGSGEQLAGSAQTIRAHVDAQLLHWVLALQVHAQPGEREGARLVLLVPEVVGAAGGRLDALLLHGRLHLLRRARAEGAVVDDGRDEVVHGLHVAGVDLVQVPEGLRHVGLHHLQHGAQTHVPRPLAALLHGDVLEPVVLEGPGDGQAVGAARGGPDEHLACALFLCAHPVLHCLRVQVGEEGVLHHPAQTARPSAGHDRRRRELGRHLLAALQRRALGLSVPSQRPPLVEAPVEELVRVAVSGAPPVGHLLVHRALLQPPVLALVQQRWLDGEGQQHLLLAHLDNHSAYLHAHLQVVGQVGVLRIQARVRHVVHADVAAHARVRLQSGLLPALHDARHLVLVGLVLHLANSAVHLQPHVQVPVSGASEQLEHLVGAHCLQGPAQVQPGVAQLFLDGVELQGPLAQVGLLHALRVLAQLQLRERVPQLHPHWVVDAVLAAYSVVVDSHPLLRPLQPLPQLQPRRVLLHTLLQVLLHLRHERLHGGHVVLRVVLHLQRVCADLRGELVCLVALGMDARVVQGVFRGVVRDAQEARSVGVHAAA